MSDAAPTLPPVWFIHAFWRAHRILYRVTAGRLGLSRASATKAGHLRLRVIGRTTGQERTVIVSYLQDGANLVTLAMNGWASTPPQWWLNLQATPEAEVDLRDGVRQVRARAATGAERDRLWAIATRTDGWGGDKLDAFAAGRPVETDVVVLEPR